MRIIFITLLVCILCSQAVMGFADEKSDCLKNCANEKRSNNMYCPPDGGFYDEYHKQCKDINTIAYDDCVKVCSQAPAPPEQPTVAIEPSVQSE